MAKLKSKKLSKTAIRNASIAAASAAVAGVLTGCSLYGNDTYTVKFNTVGGSSVESQKIVWGEKINNPASPTKEGYTFDGWYLDANYKTKVDEVNYVVEGDVEFFAKWKINSYTITFATNGGEEIDPITKNYNSTISIDDPEREGYIFDGWYLDAALTKPFDMVVPSSDTTVYAKWIACELTITFDKNSEEAVGEMGIQTIKTNATLNQLSSNTFKREGYTFKGWAITPEGEVAYQENEVISLVNQNKEITLYAVWEANDYTISFVANNEEFSTFTGDYRSQFTLPTNTPTRNGYTFVNWGTYKLTEDEKFKGEKQYFSNVGTEKDPIYELISVVDGADVAAGLYYEIVEYTNRDIPLNGLKLFAIFTKNTYTISFNTNGGSAIANISSLYGEEITKPASPTKEGYTFKGWFTSQGQTNDDWGNEYIVFSTMPSNSFTLYAKWEINNYALSFNSNGGSEISPLNKAFGSEITLPSPTRTGYNFQGWATSLEGEVIYLPNSKYTITSAPQVLHAVWKIKSSTISFEENGGSVVEDITQDYNSSITQPETPFKVGYTFDGWFLDKEFKNEYIFSTMPEESITLYAKWVINQYTISFNSLGGSEIKDITQNYNSDVSSPSSPTKEGYSFAGWYLDEECTKAYTISKMPAENITLFAKWNINQYTITFNTNGGSDVAPITLDYNSSLVRPADPSKIGRTFAGWYSNVERTKPYIFPDKMPAENVVVYAKWNVNSYTVSFNVDGGYALQPVTMKYNDSFALPTPNKGGYSFLGWATSLDGEVVYGKNEIYTLGATNVTLYAKWVINQYTISFNTNGGDSIAPITQDYNKLLSMPTNPSKTGYTFDGWYLNETLTTPFSSSRMPADNITLYAKWNVISYTVSFNVDGGNTISPIIEEFNSSINLPSTTKTGYTFLGWASSLEGEVVYRENATYTLGASNVTLHAVWEANTNTKYVVNHYGANLADGGYSPILSENLEGTTDEMTSVEYVSTLDKTSPFYGFEGVNAITQENIKPDGTTIINLFYQRKTYSVSFVDEENNPLCSPVNVIYQGSVGIIPSELVRTGYDYLLSNNFTAETTIEEDVVIVVTYDLRETSIAFYNYPTNENPNIQTIVRDYGTDISSLAVTPIRTGYAFEGWFTLNGESSGIWGEKYSFTTMPEESIDLYAKWTIKQYTLSFNTNGGDSISSITQDYGSSYTLPFANKVGNTFLGWATSLEGDVVATGNINYTFVAQNVTLYAKWEPKQYTLSFDVDDGNPIPPITEDFNKTIDLPTPTKTGNTFLGWAIIENGEVVYRENETYTLGASNVTLYAKWEPKQYTLSFIEEDGSTLSSVNLNYRSSYILHELEKEGHTFAGWATSLGGSVVYRKGETYTIGANNASLYAVWIVNQYTIRFVSNGGTNVESITQNYATSLTMPTNPEKTGYEFKGWHTDVECTEAYTFPDTMPADNITLYASWKIKQYTITINTVGGSPIEPITKDYNDDITQPSDPTKLGHTFGGWYTDALYTKTYTFPSKMPATDAIIYAKWNAITYTILFEENGGTTVNNITQNYGTDISSLVIEPIRTGYTFEGWFTLNGESSGNWGEEYSFTTMPAENITLYAKWEPKQYKLSFEENGGSEVEDITQNYQTSITRPDDPTKDGHTFAGWYLDPQFKFVYSFGQMPSENFTVYAKWNVNSYLFTLVSDGVVTSNQVLTYGATLNLPTLEKYGYDFKGWATVEDGEVEYEGNSLYSITSENVTLYAIWDVKQVTYTFSVDGIVKNTVTNDYDSDFSVQNPPSYNDENNTYYFAGWKEKDAGENAVLYDFSNGSKLGMENKEYVAVFNSVPYTIKYQNKNGGTTLWETSSSAEDSSFKQYISYLYQRQNAFDYISKAIKNAVEGKDALPITVTATYFTLLLNPSLTEEIKEIGVPFNVLPFENQVAVIANQTSTTTEYALNVMNILSVFDLNNDKDVTYITYISKFSASDMAAMEVASTATSEYLTLVSAELTKYEDNAYNPYRNDGYIFNGWKTTIDADNENPTKYVYASWVKQIEAPENLRVSTIAKTYVEFSWNQVENAYGYYVNYSINGEAKPTIATQENKVPINVSANDTIEISVTTINADENGNRFETSNAYETPSLKDENITLTQESVSLNSEPCSPISYTHVITGEQEITASGDFFYKTEYGELYLFSNSSYTFKNVVAMEIISGNSFARITDQNGTPTLTTGSNAGTITFRTYKVASGTAKENETYYSYVDGSYSLVSVEVGSSVEGYYLGEEHIAKISLLVSNIGLGTELYSYTSAETSGDYLNTTEFDAYLIGAALTDSSLYTEYASGNYSNGFKFDFDINTTSGNILDFSTFPLEYTFYELDGNEWKEVSDPSSLYIYDEEQDVFYFLKSSGQYKVSISFKKDGYYETKDSSLDPNKKYYYLENGEYKLFDRENPVDATTYYEHFVNVSLPNAFKERNISKEFEFTLNDGINVFNDYGLKQAFSNKDVSSINLHSTIKSEFNSHSISYIPYLEDTGLSTKMSHSYMKYGELDIVSGTAEMTDNPSYGPLCWKQSTSTTSELDAAGTFYFLDKSGVVYVYDYTNGTHAIKDCEWKEVYGNTETKVGKFKILNDAFGNDPTYNNYGLSVGSIYTRANKESVDLKVNGNYFTIDASDLPYVMSTYGNVAGNGIVASYKIQNVKVSIFDIISGTGTSFENMSVIGNTENASETLSGSSGESLTISEQMEKTSGGILAFKNMYIGSDINLDNINISKATIGVHTTYLANATINYTHVWDIWANSIYASGGDTTSVSNSVIDPSGGASFHIEDNFYTIDDKGSSVYTYKDVVIPNSGVLTNPTFDLGYISTHVNNLVSGEEQWFKAYSMEIVAMGMKSTLESAVQNDINPLLPEKYTILQVVTDPITNLTSEKMNFVFLGKTHNINQSNTAINLDDVKVDFTFGGPIINTQTTNRGIVYTIAKEEVENPQDAEIMYNVLCVPLPEDLGTLYFITSPDGSTTLKAYFFFKNKLSATEIIYGMVELYEKQ